MIKYSLLLIITAILFSCKADKTVGEHITLFNGKDLSGWEVYGTEKWYVQDGELICESGPDSAYGYLATKEHFKNLSNLKLQTNNIKSFSF